MRVIHIYLHDSEFKESEHPRNEGGEFTSGSGGSKVGPAKGKFKTKSGEEYHVEREENPPGSGRFQYNVKTASGVAVGNAHLRGENEKVGRKLNEMVSAVGIYHEHQRKGIASALYNYIEENLGHKLKPNSALTPEGEALWASRNRNKS